MKYTTHKWSYYAIARSVSCLYRNKISSSFLSFFFLFSVDLIAQTPGSKIEVFSIPTIKNAQSKILVANDDCSAAQVVTPNGTCYSGTTAGANDSWQGTVGCQSGNNHPDVWYSFVATGSSLAVNVTAGTLTGNIEFVLVSPTSGCSVFQNVGSLCGASPLTGTINGLQTGTTYYYTI